MVCLHMSITNNGGDGYQITCDNLRREDATDKEIGMANILEQGIAAAISAAKMYAKLAGKSFLGPCAENKEVK